MQFLKNIKQKIKVPVITEKVIAKGTDITGYTILALLIAGMVFSSIGQKPSQVALATEPTQAILEGVQQKELTPEEEIANGSVTGNDVVENLHSNFPNWTKEIALAKNNDKITQKQIDTILANKDFYSQTKCDWRIMASVHYRENTLSFDMPSNSQGLFGNSKGDAGADKNQQIKNACNELMQKVSWQELDIQNKELVCNALAKYNGTKKGLSCYDKAYNSNFLYTQEPMTQCATDGCGKLSKSTNAGALLVIAKLLNN